MEGYKKILFPTDLSEESKKIAMHVKQMAEKFGSEITLIYVANVGYYYSSLEMPNAGVANFEAEVLSAAKTHRWLLFSSTAPCSAGMITVSSCRGGWKRRCGRTCGCPAC